MSTHNIGFEREVDDTECHHALLSGTLDIIHFDDAFYQEVFAHLWIHKIVFCEMTDLVWR